MKIIHLKERMSTTTLTAEEAAKLLQDAAQDWQAFWFNNGAIAKNLRELSDALASMSDEQFEHHVNPDKNDLADWLEAVIGDEQLAKKLRLLRTLAGTQAMVSRRVVELEACRAAAPAADVVVAAVTMVPASPAAADIKTAKRSAKKPVAAKKKVAAKKEKAVAKPAAKGSVWSKLLKR